MSDQLEEHYRSTCEEHWSKCPFCGRHNGTFGRPLQQHGPRCRWKGDANTNDIATSVLNYQQMIKEDDVTYLPMMHAQDELRRAKREIEALKKKLNEMQTEPK